MSKNLFGSSRLNYRPLITNNNNNNDLFSSLLMARRKQTGCSSMHNENKLSKSNPTSHNSQQAPSITQEKRQIRTRIIMPLKKKEIIRDNEHLGTTTKRKRIKMPVTPFATFLSDFYRSSDNNNTQLPKFQPYSKTGSKPSSNKPSKGNAALVETTRRAREKWQQLTDESRRVYIQISRQDTKRYYDELNEASATTSRSRQTLTKKADLGWETVLESQYLPDLSRCSRAVKKSVREQYGMPRTPPGPFILFVERVVRPKLSGRSPAVLSNNELLAEAKRLYKALDAQAMADVQQVYQASLKRYRADLAAWKRTMIEEGKPEALALAKKSRLNSIEQLKRREKYERERNRKLTAAAHSSISISSSSID